MAGQPSCLRVVAARAASSCLSMLGLTWSCGIRCMNADTVVCECDYIDAKFVKEAGSEGRVMMC